jgi:phosphoenolpyruvate carboxykinase (ATP)
MSPAHRSTGAGADGTGLWSSPALKRNLEAAELYEEVVRRGEGRIAEGGALVVETGRHTGRSPGDKFVVREPGTEQTVWWENNGSMTREAFEALKADMLRYAQGRQTFVQDLHAGADPRYRIRTRVYTEFAWHSLFIRNLLVRPDRAELADFAPDMVIIDLPGFKAEPGRYGIRSETVIACDFLNKVVLIGGTNYAGEMKKSVFTFLNYILPAQGVMPMHCSANVGATGESAIFFGLSGTGKTTLSAAADRVLIGDDEHGWGPEGVFNFEGGCYAKTIKLSEAAEPQIYATTRRFGTVLENVVIDPLTRRLDLDDDSLTENTRAGYPLTFIANASPSGQAPHPRNIVMLTADAFGVLPPIARLTPAQAIYHFLSGFTAKVAGTEKGVVEPQPTFSVCFGAPFMPRHPSEYGELLRRQIEQHRPDCWLVNTGWTGGAYGTGRRMPIQWTRLLLDAALEGRLAEVAFRKDRYFGLSVPTAVPGVPAEILDPAETWADKAAYDAQAERLIAMFVDNFARFEGSVDREIAAAKIGA